jgi:hypothetical protein
MKRLPLAVKLAGIILGILLIGGAIIVTAKKPNAHDKEDFLNYRIPTIHLDPSPTRPAYCVPIPREPTSDIPPTATPARFSTQAVQDQPTLTPIPFTHVIDLSPELPLEDKSELVVFRCDGTFDLYWGGPEINMDLAVNLGPGDVILSSSSPASLMGHHPPPPPGPETITPPTITTATMAPYSPP